VSSLDPDNAAGILTLIRDLARAERLAVLCNLHQPHLAERYCDRVVRLPLLAGVGVRSTAESDLQPA
jgi:phosphonate transport system ATP-binding protein